MTIRSRTGAAVLSVALCLPLALAAGSPRDRTTGGGQILVSTDGGAGDTIAFTAQGSPADAKGQIQYVDREGGTGQGQTQTHYTVTCVDVQGSTAYVRGVARDSAEEITLYVVDNGEGAMADMDIVAINAGDDEDQPCGVADAGDGTGLARGNAQTHDADA